MSKYLFVAAATTLINLVLITTSTIELVKAEIDPSSSLKVTSQDKLIVKGEKPAHLNAQQQSDVKGIYRTLTEFYRGLNEYNVERMSRVAISTSNDEKVYTQRMFDRLKSYRVDVSVEVQDIELITLSGNSASVKVTQLVKARGSGKAMSSQQSSSLSLIKQQGRWRISDGRTFIQTMTPDR
jgi:hypothetical protein